LPDTRIAIDGHPQTRKSCAQAGTGIDDKGYHLKEIYCIWFLLLYNKYKNTTSRKFTHSDQFIRPCYLLRRVVKGPHVEARTRPEPDIYFGA